MQATDTDTQMERLVAWTQQGPMTKGIMLAEKPDQIQ